MAHSDTVLDMTDPHFVDDARELDDGEIADKISEMSVKDVLELIEQDDALCELVVGFIKDVATANWCSLKNQTKFSAIDRKIGDAAFDAAKALLDSH